MAFGRLRTRGVNHALFPFGLHNNFGFVPDFAADPRSRRGCRSMCSRTGQAIAFIDNQRQIWLAAINKNNLPEDVKNAYIIIVNHAHDTAVGGAKLKNMDCTKKYEGDQAIMNVAVTIFSQGLSLLAPGKTAYIDVSEIEHGYPLGGPDALIPKLREQILAATTVQFRTLFVIQFNASRLLINAKLLGPAACV